MKQKEWIIGFLAILSTVMTGALLLLLMKNSGTLTVSEEDSSKSDSTEFVQVIEQYYNPVVTSVGGAIMVQNKMIDEFNLRNVFREMPQSVLKNVTNVVINRSSGNTITIYDISKEYLTNRKVYDNLGRKQDVPIVSQKPSEENDSLNI
nr:MAG TPA: hypothetical protein [Caudoviricetes sp.]